MQEAVLNTNLPFPVRRGKVRDVYDLGDRLLIVATDRISAFDVVMPNGIPGKGKILTALSAFWFDHFKGQIENHLISTAVKDFPREAQRFAAELAGRSMLVKKTQVVPVECVARGYLAGSAWSEYKRSGTVCGIPLRPGLSQCDKLPEPIFTPATKEESGHDVNIDFRTVAQRFGEPLANELRERTLNLYRRAADHAAKRGVIIADTKFEFGLLESEGGRLILIDEILTPDSSRFWPADEFEPGHDQASFDKQFVRNWLEAQDWDKTPPAPKLPKEVVWGTRARYLDAYEKLTGKRLELE
jgi:phosphoribosylaminoimidazole-succinocarboxamide synthase